MVPTRFSSLVLGLVCVLHALSDSSAYAHEGSEIYDNGLMATSQKELLDDVLGGAVRKMKVGGRKMMSDEVSRREIEREGELKGVTNSMISGKDTNAWKRTGRSQDLFNNQNNSPMLKPKTLNSESLGASGKESVQFPSTKKPQHLQDSMAVLSSSSRPNYKQVSSQEHVAQKDESNGLVEAADEIMNMMRKDYLGMDKPRSKPPINNHKPTD